MNSFFRNASYFIKRYAVIILVCILTGNLIAWLNAEKSGHYYQYSVKARSRVDYYDLVKTPFDKISAAISDSASASTPLKAAPIESYRNEDFYYTEMKLRFTDTSAASGVMDHVITLVKSDSELKARYFDRLENMDRLIAEAKQLHAYLSGQNDSAGRDAVFTRVELFRSNVALMNLMRDRDNFGLNVSISFPSSKEFTSVQTGYSAKTFLTATVLFFIIGLFTAVVFDRFRS